MGDGDISSSPASSNLKTRKHIMGIDEQRELGELHGQFTQFMKRFDDHATFVTDQLRDLTKQQRETTDNITLRVAAIEKSNAVNSYKWTIMNSIGLAVWTCGTAVIYYIAEHLDTFLNGTKGTHS